MVLLFFFAAFGTVDHRQTGIVYEISGTVLNCFRSYLQDGGYLLSLCNYEFKFESENLKKTCMWSSSLIHALILKYMLLLAQIMGYHNILYHIYATEL